MTICAYDKCQREFTPTRSDARYCCTKHRVYANRQKPQSKPSSQLTAVTVTDKVQLISIASTYISEHPGDYDDILLAMQQAKVAASLNARESHLWELEVQAQGFVDERTACKLSGLTSKEYDEAKRRQFISPARTWQRRPKAMFRIDYYDPAKLKLSDEQLKIIREDTMLSRHEAAKYLGITSSDFTKLVKKHGIQHDDIYRTTQGTGYLWKQKTLEPLRSIIEQQKESPKSSRKKKSSLPDLPSLTRTELEPFKHKPLKALFDFCAAEYEKRWDEKWIYDGGELKGSNKDGYHVFVEQQVSGYQYLDKFHMGHNRYWLERTLLDDVNHIRKWIGTGIGSTKQRVPYDWK